MIDQDITDLIQTNGQVESKIFIYKVIDNLTKFSIAIIASSATQAKEALRQQVTVDASITYVSTVDRVMQL